MKDILCVTGRKLLDILLDTGVLTQEDVEKNCRRLRRPTQEIAAAVCGNMTLAERRLLKQLLHKLDSAREDITSILEDMRLLSQPFQEQIAIIDSIPGFDEESAIEIIAEISEVP
jgi:hypothetical protein